MKKLLIAICMLSFVVNAADKKPLTDAGREAKRAEMMKRTGGPIKLPPQGFVALVDCQT